MSKPNSPNTNANISEDAAALLKPPNVGRMLAVTSRYVLILAERGDLACVRIAPKAIRFRREDVDAFIEARRHPASDSPSTAAASITKKEDRPAAPAGGEEAQS